MGTEFIRDRIKGLSLDSVTNAVKEWIDTQLNQQSHHRSGSLKWSDRHSDRMKSHTWGQNEVTEMGTE